MAARLDPHDVLVFGRGCVARPQEGAYLLYNRATDELHLVPPSGYFIVQLCDGLRTIGDIEAALVHALSPAGADVRGRLQGFLIDLVDRGLLEVLRDH